MHELRFHFEPKKRGRGYSKGRTVELMGRGTGRRGDLQGRQGELQGSRFFHGRSGEFFNECVGIFKDAVDLQERRWLLQ